MAIPNSGKAPNSIYARIAEVALICIIAVLCALIVKDLVSIINDRLENTPPESGVIFVNDQGDITKYVALDGEVVFSEGSSNNDYFVVIDPVNVPLPETGWQFSVDATVGLDDGTQASATTVLDLRFGNLTELIRLYNDLSLPGDNDGLAFWVGDLYGPTAKLISRTFREIKQDIGETVQLTDTGETDVDYDAAVAQQYDLDMADGTLNGTYFFDCVIRTFSAELTPDFLLELNRRSAQFASTQLTVEPTIDLRVGDTEEPCDSLTVIELPEQQDEDLPDPGIEA